MDLGIDDLGEIWFFEANAKPMKFDEPQIRKSHWNVFSNIAHTWPANPNDNGKE